LHKVLMATAASLVLSAAAGAAQAQDWTGFYVGASFGYADRSESSGETILFDTNLDNVFNDTVRNAAGANAFSPGFCGGSFNTNSAAGGCRDDDDTDFEWSVRAGYDQQFGSFVVGAVVEYSRLELQDSVTAFSSTPASYAFTRKLTDLKAIRARGGWAMGPTLFYATGGYAEGNMKQSFNTTNTANSFPETGGGDADGWQWGLGVEHQFMPNLSVGLEFLRTNLEDDSGYGVRASNSGTTPVTNAFLLVNTGGTNFLRSEEDFEINSFRVTASWRF
jgi:outer membrane immunogenic protein